MSGLAAAAAAAAAASSSLASHGGTAGPPPLEDIPVGEAQGQIPEWAEHPIFFQQNPLPPAPEEQPRLQQPPQHAVENPQPPKTEEPQSEAGGGGGQGDRQQKQASKTEGDGGDGGPDVSPSPSSVYDEAMLAKLRQELSDVAYFRNVALRSGAFLLRPRRKTHGIQCFEGANLHLQLDTSSSSSSAPASLANRWLCSYSGKLCLQKRMEGWGFCNKHYLEDPRAPVAQCQYISKQHGRRCQLALNLVDATSAADHSSGALDTADNAASVDYSITSPDHSDTLFDSRFCHAHKQALGMSMPRTLTTHMTRKRKAVEKQLGKSARRAASAKSDLDYLRENADPDWFFDIVVQAGLDENTAFRAQQREHFVSEFLQAYHVQSSAPAARALRRLKKTPSTATAVVNTADCDSSSDDDYEYGSALPLASNEAGNPGVGMEHQNRHALRPMAVKPHASGNGQPLAELTAQDDKFLWELMGSLRDDRPAEVPEQAFADSSAKRESATAEELQALRQERLKLLRDAYAVQYSRIVHALRGPGDADVAGVHKLNQRNSDAPYPVGVVGTDEGAATFPDENTLIDSSADFLKWKTSVLFRREQERYTQHRRLHAPMSRGLDSGTKPEFHRAAVSAGAGAAVPSTCANCSHTAMPESPYCRLHILNDPMQRLFAPCCGELPAGVASGDSQQPGDGEDRSCGYPIVLGSKPPLCAPCLERNAPVLARNAKRRFEEIAATAAGMPDATPATGAASDASHAAEAVVAKTSLASEAGAPPVVALHALPGTMSHVALQAMPGDSTMAAQTTISAEPRPNQDQQNQSHATTVEEPSAKRARVAETVGCVECNSVKNHRCPDCGESYPLSEAGLEKCIAHQTRREHYGGHVPPPIE